MSRGEAAPAAAAAPAPGTPSAPYRLLRWVLRLVPIDNQVRLPDRSLFWWPAALREARAVARAWRPDVILSSHGPPGSHIVASRLARELGVPWVADFRDPWSGHYGRRYPPLLERLEARIERAVVRPAAAITTVSEHLAAHFAALHGKPVTTIYNGFDEEDYACPVEPSGEFVITYTGVAESPHRSPEPLFAALALLRREEAAPLPRVHFVGSTDPAFLRALADRHGVGDLLHIEGSVPRRRSVELQRRSTVLLVLNWGGQGGGMLSGKLTEYLGAARPILAVGPEDSGVTDVLRRTGAGVWAETAPQVAAVLREWMRTFAATGRLALPVDAHALGAFSRRTQARQLAEVLDAALGGRR